MTRSTASVLVVLILSCATVEGTTEVPNYDRGDWKHWVDLDGDCQDARQEELVEGSEIEPTYRDDKKCSVATGKWTDPYTGQVFTDASDLDIDHVVALKDAHESGGAFWDDARRQAFANDPNNLIPVSSSANRSKGSRGPDEWLPPLESYRCEYIELWVKLKADYGLSSSACERSTIEYMMRICEAGMVPPLPQ